MAFNGAGLFNRLYNWVNDKNNNIPITASRMDDEMNGMAAGLSTCITRDGQTTVLNNIPMNGFKFTNLGSGSVRTDSATLGQVQDGGTSWCGAAGGTANAITLSPTPGIAAYSAGQMFEFVVTAANTGATTVNAGPGIKSLLKSATKSLAANDLPLGLVGVMWYDGTNFQLINPQGFAQSADIASAATTSLDAANGGYVNITGTVNINAVTLVQGGFIIAKFAGILTIANGASLILPSGANIITAAGDTAEFIGEAAGVVRMVSYTRASGVPLVINGLSINPTTPAPANFTQINGGQIAGLRNGIINGGMQIWQTGVGAYNLTTTPQYSAVGNFGLPDRWVAWMATAAAGTAQQNTSVPTGLGFRYSLRVGRTAASALVNSVVVYHALTTDDSIRFQGQQVTFSFYAKAGANYSGAGGNLGLQLYTGTGTDQNTALLGSWTGSATPINSSAALTAAWTRYTFTATLSGTATQIGFGLSYVPTGVAGADDNFYITGFQLEQGPTATPFEWRPWEIEYAMCLPYRRKSFPYATTPAAATGNSGSIGFISSAAGAFGYTLPFDVRLRKAPNRFTTYNPTTAASTAWRDITAGADRTFTGGANDVSGAFFYGSGGVAASDNRIHYDVEAELA